MSNNITLRGFTQFVNDYLEYEEPFPTGDQFFLSYVEHNNHKVEVNFLGIPIFSWKDSSAEPWQTKKEELLTNFWQEVRDLRYTLWHIEKVIGHMMKKETDTPEKWPG